MKKLKNIVNGWKSYIINDSVTIDIAKKRASICADCDKPVKGGFEILMPDFSIKEIQGLKCSVCGCPLSTATRSENYNCPLKKW